MFNNLFKKTYKQKVEDFWEEFVGKRTELEKIVDDAGRNEVAGYLSLLLYKIVDQVSWSFVPPQKDNNYALALSPSGNRTIALLLEYWKDLAPEIKGWEFYSSKPRNPNAMNLELDIFDLSFNISDLQIKIKDSSQKEKFDLLVYYDEFKELDKEQFYTVIFIILDEILGEEFVEVWLGEIELVTSRKEGFTTIKDLRDELISKIVEKDWNLEKKLIDLYTLYNREPSAYSVPRSDIIVGYTKVPYLLREDIKNPLKDTGAGYYYLQLDHKAVEKEALVQVREKISEELEQVLKVVKVGRVIGSATGIDFSYVDIILFDYKDGRRKLDSYFQSSRKMDLIEIHKFFKN